MMDSPATSQFRITGRNMIDKRNNHAAVRPDLDEGQAQLPVVSAGDIFRNVKLYTLPETAIDRLACLC